MIPYRFLSPAEEEMTESALFYESIRKDSEMISLMTYNGQSIGCLLTLTPASR